MLPLGLMKPAKGANADYHGPSDGSTFHDLDKLFPHAPIPVDGGVILRNGRSRLLLLPPNVAIDSGGGA